MLIYKVFRAAEWAELEKHGRTRSAPVDLADGYVHFSTADQVRETLARHFVGETDLVFAAVDADRAGPALKWEPARGGAPFAHLYRELQRSDVLWARPLRGASDLPADMT